LSVASRRAATISAPNDRVVDRLLAGHGILLYAFLYLPIVVVVVYAFNESRLAQVWHGFSLR
jgi:ABC-type spermidine/putrescine transport system permease subunit II